MQKEEWKDIHGYENTYQVSSLGRVRSLRYRNTDKTKILKISFFRTGYARVSLQKNRRSVSKLVHRLVAEAFIPNPENKPQVNHINGDKSDNSIKNLEWMTNSENINHYWRKMKNKPYRLSSGRHNDWQWKKVKCVETGEIFPTIASAAKSIGVCDKAISQLLQNPHNRHTAGGYHWEQIL